MAYNGYTEARKKANIKYMQDKTDNIQLRLPRGTRELWKEAAELAGYSMTQYVKMAVEKQMEEDKMK